MSFFFFFFFGGGGGGGGRMGVYLSVMTDQVVHQGNPNYVPLTQRVGGLMFWCGSRLRQRGFFVSVHSLLNQ